MDWNLILGIVGLVLGIVSLVTGIIFYLKSKRAKEPCYAMKTETLIAGYSAKFDDLTVLYKDKEIENLSVSRILFWNNGNETIDKIDIARKSPVVIAADESIEILDAKVLEQNNFSNSFSLMLSPDGDFAIIMFDYIDKGQGAVFQVIHTGTSPDTDLVVVGNIKGAKDISFKWTQRPERFSSFVAYFYSIMGFITSSFLLIPSVQAEFQFKTK